jgi:uroporphyrinogen-III synthase
LRLLVTRPALDAAPLAKLLEEKGHRVTLEPLLEIAALKDAAVDLSGVQALLFTSANGVRAFAGLCPERSLPVYAVGDATAKAAREAGFAQVESADGDVDDLARLVAGKCDPKKGALLHPAASKVAGDLLGLLQGKGFDVRRTVIYESCPAQALSLETVRLFEEGGLDGVLFFSPRTAQSFASLAGQANIKGRLDTVVAFALSSQVAERLEGLPFLDVRVAQSPDQAALLNLIDEASMTSEVEPKEPQPSESSVPGDSVPPPLRSTGRALKAFLLGGILGIALVAGSGAALWSVLVDSLKKEVAQAESSDPATAVNTDEIAGLKSKDETLARRLADLEAKLAVSPEAGKGVSPEELERLNGRFAKLEQEMQAASAKRDAGPAQLLATMLLRDAALSGRGFAREFETLTRLQGNEAAQAQSLNALKPLAEKGLSSEEALAQRFQSLKPQLLRSTLDANEDLWSGIKRRLSALISIRKIDVANDAVPGLDGIVAKAEASLAKHDLAGAAAALGLLGGPAAELAKPWLEDAAIRLEAEKTLNDLLEQALSHLVKS